MVSKTQHFVLIVTILLSTTPGLSHSPSSITFTDCFLADCSDFDNDSTISFGFLEVLENPDSSNGKRLKIAFAILKSLSDAPKKEPVLFLSGGPGNTALRKTADWTDHFLRQDRDIVLTDFRGIGYSGVPICADLTDGYYKVVAGNYSPVEEQEAKMKVVFDCFDSLKAQHFDFSAYRSKTIINDLEELRQALGYKQWNLYGGSYGTRLGQTYIRDAPGGVRAFISDATHPVGLDVLGNESATYRKSLNEVFALCIADPSCGNQFPNLETRFYSALEKLKYQPLVLEDDVFPNGKFYVNFQNAHQIFQQLLYFRSFYAALPWFVKAMENGDDEAFKNIVSLLKDRFNGISMVNFLMVMRNDAFANIRKSNLSENDPLYKALAFTEIDYEIYHQMNFFPYDSIERVSVKSDIPTLILAGSLDPISPPEHGRFVHQNFPNSYFMEFNGMGHGVMSSSCAKQIAVEFLNQPQVEPNRMCLTNLKESKINFQAKIYENGKITTMLRRLAINKEIGLLLPLLLSFILWIIAMFAVLTRLLRRTPTQPKIFYTRLMIRSTSTLICFFFLGLAWYIYETVTNHELLIVVGLISNSNFLFWLTPLIMPGTAIGCFLLIKNWNSSEDRWNKSLNTSLVITQLTVIVLLFTFNLFPVI